MAVSAPERIAQLAHELDLALSGSIGLIQDVNDSAHVLSINARIEAARAGSLGRGFGVIADAFGTLNREITTISGQLTENCRDRLEQLRALSAELAGSVRGQRLVHLAHSVMDLVDRNLYERSCDVRWWASEAAVVAFLEGKVSSEEVRDRLATILRAYTVYEDIVVVDPRGSIVANGRPERFAVEGLDVSGTPWFQTARAVELPEEFGFQSAHSGPLAAGAPVLVYSSPVRGGDTFLGVLGVVFRWNGLGRANLLATAKVIEEDADLVIVEPEGRIIASTDDRDVGKPVLWPGVQAALKADGSHYRMVDEGGGRCLLARGLSPGFETYATGWSCLILQKL